MESRTHDHTKSFLTAVGNGGCLAGEQYLDLRHDPSKRLGDTADVGSNAGPQLLLPWIPQTLLVFGRKGSDLLEAVLEQGIGAGAVALHD